MTDSINIILEMIKISVPALIVFFTAYYILKNMYKSQIQAQHLKIKSEDRKVGLQIRLQAYERLALFCERINPPNLLLRLRSKDMSNEGLRIALVISVQKEYEHNLVQQIYVSENLWKIVLLAKEYVLKLIDDNYDALDKDSDSSQLADRIMRVHDSMVINPWTQALNAIKKETEHILN